MKKILVLSVIAVALIITAVTLFILKKNDNSKSVEATKTTDNTGVIIQPKSDFETRQDQEDTRLFNMMPVSGVGFKVEYYAVKDVYRVTLALPYEESRINFYSWIQQNNFSEMPKDRFELIIQ